jgi:hypothetical protein
MRIDVNLEIYRKVDITSAKLQEQISELEKNIDDYCLEFVKTQEDLQLVSFFHSILNECYKDLEDLTTIKSVLYN